MKAAFCFVLAYNSRTGTDTRSELGTRFDRALALYITPCSLRARLAWAHDWVSDLALAAVFQMLPGASFVVDGATPAKNSGSPPPALSFASPTASRSSASSTVSLPAPGRCAMRGSAGKRACLPGPRLSNRSGTHPSTSASLIGRLGSSAFRLSTSTVSMSLTGSCFSSESAPRPFHHGIRRRGGTIFGTALPSV